MKIERYRWHIAVSLIVLAAAVAGALSHRPPQGIGKDNRPLFKDLPVNQVAGISIQNADGKVSLSQKDGRWVVDDRHDYPADPSKISGFMEKLRITRVGRTFALREDIKARLKLYDPVSPDITADQKGTRVRFTGKAGNSLADILLGKSRRRDGTGVPDSHYLVTKPSGPVYLVDMPFSDLPKTPSQWLHMPVIEVPAHDIQKIVFYEPDADTPTYVFIRSQADNNLIVAQTTAPQTPDGEHIKRLEWALAYLTFEDILLPHPCPDKCRPVFFRLDYYLFNGLIYRVFPAASCEAENSCGMKIEVAAITPPNGLPDAIAKNVEALNARFGPWVYETSSSNHKNFAVAAKP